MKVMLNKVLIPLNENEDGNLDKLLISGWKKEETVKRGDLVMKATLEELKEIMNGIIGSFIVDEEGDVAAFDLPQLLEEKAKKISKLIFYVINIIKASRPFERIIIDSENVKIIAILSKGRILVVVADKNINLPLLKLVSNITVSKLKDDRKAAESPRELAIADVNRICNFYDELYGLVAKNLFDVFGPESAQMFEGKVVSVREDHSQLLENLSFGTDGKPKISKLKLNSSGMTKDELLTGLEDILVSMLEALKDNAGPMIADKAIDKIIKIKEEHKGEI
jgi:predicted regulator of Ras-like GTPase activity (Roadblock/LC7/MglB family)